MLRAVLSEVEVVLSSSSNLREPAVIPSSSLVVTRRQRSGPLLPRVRRLKGAFCQARAAVVVLRRWTGPALASRSVRVGRAGRPLRRALGACKYPGPKRSRPASGRRPQSCPKRRAAQPGASSGRLPPFQAIMVLRTESLRGALVACG
jgi:hypothetical protein